MRRALRLRALVGRALRRYALVRRAPNLCALCLLVLWMTASAAPLMAQDRAAAARALVDVKGGYIERKRDLEHARALAYVPLMVKAVRQGADWTPRHADWERVETRVRADWLGLNADHQRALGRDPGYGWLDAAVARAYAEEFDAGELDALAAFHATPAGRLRVELDRALAAFLPRELLQAMSAVLFFGDALTRAEAAIAASPEHEARRLFLALLETDAVVEAEALRVGGPPIGDSYRQVHRAALVKSAERIDALRARLSPAMAAEIAAFLDLPLGRKERLFLARVLPTAVPKKVDPGEESRIETAMLERLQQMQQGWRGEFAR